MARTAVTAPAGRGSTGRRARRWPTSRDGEWTADDLSKGRHLSHKYRKQLAARTAAMIQRLTGADSVEVIDADTMEETHEQTWLTLESLNVIMRRWKR